HRGSWPRGRRAAEGLPGVAEVHRPAPVAQVPEPPPVRRPSGARDQGPAGPRWDRHGACGGLPGDAGSAWFAAAVVDRRGRGAVRMKAELGIRGIDGVLKTLNSLPAEVVSKRGGPVKLSLAKGARFLRDRYKERLRRAIHSGKTTRSTGELEKRVIASRGKKPFGTKGERYLVRIKKRDYLNADGVRTNPLMVAN